MPNGPFYAPGAYIAEVVNQGFNKAKTGNQQFVLQVKILGTPDGDSMMPCEQQYDRTIYMTLTEKTAPYVVEALRHIGYTGNSFGPLDPSHPQHHSFVRQQIDVFCKHEADQQGTVRDKWQISTGAPALKVEPLTPKDIRDLDSLFGRELKSKGAQPVPARAAQQANATVITDDDIPF